MTSPASSPASSLRVLFVCMGNICRSPMAHAVLEDMVRPRTTGGGGGTSSSTTAAEGETPAPRTTVHVDSAGTGAWHVGDEPDGRTLRTLDKHGVQGVGGGGFTHAARKVRTRDFVDFDYVLAMDDDNLDDLRGVRQRAGREHSSGGGAGAGGGAGDGLAKLAMFGEYGCRKKGRGEAIADPYYGNGDGFEVAYEQCVRFSKAFLEEALGNDWEARVGRTKI